MAFEGSIKEAYHVLADKDPTKLRPFDIEQYLEKENIFRDRILTQFTNYRTEWRNPASHDYNLDFDEAEAFLAIVSVSAFTKLLVDEITERLSYVAVKKEAAVQKGLQTTTRSSSQPLISQLTAALADFPRYYTQIITSPPIESEAQLLGALSGFLTAAFPHAQTTTGQILRGPKPAYVDIVITSEQQSIFIEIKRGDSSSLEERGVAQLSDYLSSANTKYAVLFLYSDKSTDYGVTVVNGPQPGTEIYLVRPTRSYSIT